MKKKLTIKGAVQLAAPHTWPASVLPVLLGAALSLTRGAALEPWLLLGTLVTAVLLQSAVNTLNDCRDFARGLDSAENCPDHTDAALVYECSDLRAAVALGLGFMLCAAGIGAVLVYFRGAGLLAYAGIAAAAIFLYTMPGISMSDMPMGELLSGLTMGGALTCASYHVQAGEMTWFAAAACLPAVMTIACIMLTNNTADVEKDIQGGRRTFSVLVGRKAAVLALRCSVALAALIAAAVTLIFFPGGAAALPLFPAALLLSQRARGVFTLPVTQETRIQSMGAILSAHSFICAVYTAAAVLAALS